MYCELNSTGAILVINISFVNLESWLSFSEMYSPTIGLYRAATRAPLSVVLSSAETCALALDLGGNRFSSDDPLLHWPVSLSRHNPDISRQGTLIARCSRHSTFYSTPGTLVSSEGQTHTYHREEFLRIFRSRSLARLCRMYTRLYIRHRGTRYNKYVFPRSPGRDPLPFPPHRCYRTTRAFASSQVQPSIPEQQCPYPVEFSVWRWNVPSVTLYAP